MKKREGEVKEILDLAGSVIADKGFQGSGYVTPAKKRGHQRGVTAGTADLRVRAC
jgi:hypothetical protein